MSSWESDLAIFNYNKLTKSLGLPDWLAVQKGGKAGWNKYNLDKDKLCFCEIIVEDDPLPHQKYHGEYHCDTLIVAVEVFVPYRFVPKMLCVCRSLIYDRQKQKLMARGASFGECVVALRLALETIYKHYHFKHLFDAYHCFMHEVKTEHGLKHHYLRLYHLLKTTHHYFPLEMKCEKQCDESRIGLVEMDEIAVLRKAMQHDEITMECVISKKSSADQ